MKRQPTTVPQPVGRVTELVLVRHGVTAWNKSLRFQGQVDTDLDEEGRVQAAHLARRIERARHQAPVHAVYSSDLARARQTAQPVADALGLPLQDAPGLRERNYGAFEGCTSEELQRDHGPAFARWRARDPDFVLPGGGESLRALHERVRLALLELAGRHPGERIVAVTHGGVLDCAYRIASGLDLSAPRRHDLLNASLNRVGWDGLSFSLIAWADVDHLSAPAE